MLSHCWEIGSWLLWFSLVCGLRTVCLGLSGLPLDGPSPMIVAILGRLLYYFIRHHQENTSI